MAPLFRSLEPEDGLEQDLSYRIDITRCQELGRASALELAPPCNKHVPLLAKIWIIKKRVACLTGKLAGSYVQGQFLNSQRPRSRSMASALDFQNRKRRPGVNCFASRAPNSGMSPQTFSWRWANIGLLRLWLRGCSSGLLEGDMGTGSLTKRIKFSSE